MIGWQFRFLTWFSSCLAAGSWPLFLTTPRLNWTLVVIPLVLTASAAVQLTGYRRVYRAPVDVSGPHSDYIAIARMEREVYGESFRHDGAAAAGFGPFTSVTTPEGYEKRLYPCPGCGVRQQRLGSACYCPGCGWRFPATTGA